MYLFLKFLLFIQFDGKIKLTQLKKNVTGPSLAFSPKAQQMSEVETL